MTAIAHPPVQCSKRTASAVFFLLALACWGLAASAQEAVYRCGHEYTNKPRDLQRCERLASQAVTVITGTRPAAPPPAKPAKTASTEGEGSSPMAKTPAAIQAPMPETGSTTRAQQAARDEHAREVLLQELSKAQAQLAQLQQTFNHGTPEKWASESRHHQQYLERVAGLKAAIERSERDIDSLQRELARRPVLAHPRTP
jgi:hypothetical protein